MNPQDKIKFLKFLKYTHTAQKKSLIRLSKKTKNKEKIRVGFFIIFSSIFPAQSVYESMLEDEMFDPFIVIIPDISRGEDHMRKTMTLAYDKLSQKYANVIIAYDEKNKTFKDVSSMCDLFCTANPYDYMTLKNYTVEYYSKKGIPSFYLNYAYPSSKHENNTIFSRLNFLFLWKIFAETPFIEAKIKERMRVKASNVVLSGFAKMDLLAKIVKRERKRKCIIIAPHWSIIEYSTPLHSTIPLRNLGQFLQYANLFLDIPAKYPEIDFIFRPHPLLLNTLKGQAVWGKEKADKYLKELQSHPNLTLQIGGEYLDSFANSDAIIQDCMSFLSSYMFTDKPTCYLLKNESSIDEIFMQNGKDTLAHCYKAYKEEDIINFIDNVIVGENDWMLEKRTEYVDKNLKINYPHVADFIVNDIKEGILDSEKLY